MQMRSRSFRNLGPNGFHEVAWHEWGDPANDRVLICVHGMSRNGRDFEVLAEALSDTWRVVCPDMPGRGDSEYLSERTDYNYDTYCQVCATLIAATGAKQVDWIGTSMGGLIGMMLAAKPNTPIRRMVLNDIGPLVAESGLKRIGDYVGVSPGFRDFDQAYRAIRATSATFGPMTEAQWRRWVEISLKQDGDRLMPNYDPEIAWAMKEKPVKEVRMWRVWDKITAPVMVLRGEKSDLLTREGVEEMRGRGPGCEVMEVPGIGHCPALCDAPQIEAIRGFLENGTSQRVAA